MSPRSGVMLLLPIVVALAAASSAHATWSHDPAVNLPVCAAPGNQGSPRALADGAGGAYVAWADARTSPSIQLYWQHVNADGALWAPDGVPIVTPPSNDAVGLGGLLSDGAGGVIVWWTHEFANGDVQCLAQRYTAAGTPMWATGGVPISVEYPFLEPGGAAPDGTGGLIVSFSLDHGFVTPNDDLYAQRVDGNGVTQWGAAGVALCTLSGGQNNSAVVSDGVGGAIVCWADGRAGNLLSNDLYAQHVNAAGVTTWPANGQLVSDLGGTEFPMQMVSDGAGGAVVTWTEALNSTASSSLNAQHLASSGARTWGTGGIVASAGTTNPTQSCLVPDGQGGIFAAWLDNRFGGYNIFEQHVTRSGARLFPSDEQVAPGVTIRPQLLTLVPTSGQPIPVWDDNSGAYRVRESASGTDLTTSGEAENSTAVSDGHDGLIGVWEDYRNGNVDLYAQRVDQWNVLGDAAPKILGVQDVPADQGGAVRISWQPSYLDAGAPAGSVANYRVWRSVPTLSAAGMALRARRGVTSDAGEAAASGKLWVGAAAQGYAWESIGSLASQSPVPAAYSLVVPTALDSVPVSNPLTAFLVQALETTSSPVPSWFSAPDSGYSVDNLAPAPPGPLSGTYAAGTTRLHWPPNAEADFSSYHVYRGTTPGFIPSPGNLLVAKPDTGLVDVAGAAYVYRLTALDIHGNESAASVFPSATTDAGDATADLAFALEPPSPNPARASTTIRFTLPRSGTARLDVFDTAGRRVRVLLNEAVTAGIHTQRFPLSDGVGHDLASGLYLVRLEAAGRVLTRRVAVVR
jgi:hypothetical protein